MILETTYQASTPRRDRTEAVQALDTATLQKTHWTGGNFPSEQLTEYKEEYVRFPLSSRNRPTNRDELMRTHFKLGTEDAVEPEIVERAVPYVVEPTPNYKEQLIATHFNLKDPDAPPWTTTTRSDYRPHSARPVRQAEMELMRGQGMKDCFAMAGQFPTKFKFT